MSATICRIYVVILHLKSKVSVCKFIVGGTA